VAYRYTANVDIDSSYALRNTRYTQKLQINIAMQPFYLALILLLNYVAYLISIRQIIALLEVLMLLSMKRINVK